MGGGGRCPEQGMFWSWQAPAKGGCRVDTAAERRRGNGRGGQGLWWFYQFSSVAQLCLTLWNPMDCSTPGFPVHHHSQSLLKLISIKSVMPFNHLILCHPLLLSPSIFPSIRVFSMSQFFISGGQSVGVSTSASVLPMNIQLISFRMGWLDLLVVQGTLKSLLQHHSSKASILRCSAFLMVQPSHLCMTTCGSCVAQGGSVPSAMVERRWSLVAGGWNEWLSCACWSACFPLGTACM